MIGLIAARSNNNIIGKDGRIPWNIKGEQKLFKELTMGHTVVMGRKTYEEIGHPLHGRQNIIVSTTMCCNGDNLTMASSLTDALELAENTDVYVAGGYALYKEAIPLVDIMYITEVDIYIEDGDVCFPEFDVSDFDLITGDTYGDDIKYTRTTYIRKNKGPLQNR